MTHMAPLYSQIERLHRASKETDSWSDLEKRVKDKKDPLLDMRMISMIKDKEWFTLAVASANTLMTGMMRKNPNCPISFPASSVQKDGIAYHIHGIIHDMRNRRIIKERFASLENVILESDLSVIYPLHGIDHPRHDELKYLTALDSVLLFLRPRIIFSQLVDCLLFFRRQRTAEETGSYRKTGQVLVGKEYVSVDISETVLPEHLAHSWLGYHLEDRFYRTCLLRSLAFTEYLEHRAQRMDVSEMHALVGLGHERQITYFLENPDKATMLADIYQPSWIVRQMRRLRSPSAILAYAGYQNAQFFFKRGSRVFDSIIHGDYNFALLRYPLVDTVFAAGMVVLMFGVLYRKHKHRFTNRMYVRSLLPPAKRSGE